MLHKVNRVLLPVSLLGISLLLAACGGGGGGDGDGDGGSIIIDTTAPGISSTSPADSATAVARSGSLTATFDEDIFATTVDAASFTLAQPGAGNTPGNVVFDGASNVASFTPDSPLAVLADYTATLNTAITDLSGNALAADYNWSFTTADGTWGSGALLETDAGDADYPQIAVDSNGNALAVWRQSDGTRSNIWANRFDGSIWGSAELIETDDAGRAGEPQIAIDSNGNALAVWHQFDGTRRNIWANRFNGSIWGSAELIETDDVGDAGFPQIAIDSNGNALAVWSQFDGTRYNIWANRFNGTNWGSAELIEADAGNASGPQIAFDSNGNALAVWRQSDGTRNNIWARRFDGTNWGSAELIETDNAGTAHGPQIAFDSNGNALAVWQQFDGTRYNIWANRFDGINWGSAELIEADAGDARGPQIAIDSNGNALAVWQQSDGIRTNIWVNRFNGSIWGSAVLLETDSAAGDASNPLITFDNNGNALMGWNQDDGTRFSSWARRFDGTNWGAPVLIETDAFDAYAPQIAIDSNGNALAVWEQFDGTRYNIWVRRFE